MYGAHNLLLVNQWNEITFGIIFLSLFYYLVTTAVNREVKKIWRNFNSFLLQKILHILLNFLAVFLNMLQKTNASELSKYSWHAFKKS